MSPIPVIAVRRSFRKLNLIFYNSIDEKQRHRNALNREMHRRKAALLVSTSPIALALLTPWLVILEFHNLLESITTTDETINHEDIAEHNTT